MGVIGIHNVGLSVQSVLDVANFFVDKMGFKVEFKLDLKPVFARVHIGNNYLHLFETTSKKKQPKRSMFVSQNFPGFDYIAIACDDVDQAFESMKEKGVEFDSIPFTYPEWGVRLVAFKDPEENWYYLFQRLMS